MAREETTERGRELFVFNPKPMLRESASLDCLYGVICRPLCIGSGAAQTLLCLVCRIFPSRLDDTRTASLSRSVPVSHVYTPRCLPRMREARGSYGISTPPMGPF